jgi:hypothetical protein
MAKDSFIVYTKFGEQVKLLTDTQAGVLFKALIDYQSGEELPKMDGMTNIVFSVIRQQIDFDNRKYQEVCNTNKANGQRGGRPSKSLETKGNKPKKPSGLESEEEKPSGLSKNRTKAKKPESDNEYEYDTDIIPPFYSPLNGEKKENPFEKEFYEKYPRYAKDRNKMRVDADYKRLLEEFEKSTYLRSLYTVKQINEIYPCILTGDYRDQEKKPSPVVDADAKADRERFYSLRRHRAIAESEKIKATFMKDETFAKIVKRLREIDCEQGKAEARGDRVKASKLEQEKARLLLQKRGIIERNGMTEEDLEPEWNCVKCKDTGFVNGIPCDCYEG